MKMLFYLCLVVVLCLVCGLGELAHKYINLNFFKGVNTK